MKKILAVIISSLMVLIILGTLSACRNEQPAPSLQSDASGSESYSTPAESESASSESSKDKSSSKGESSSKDKSSSKSESSDDESSSSLKENYFQSSVML